MVIISFFYNQDRYLLLFASKFLICCKITKFQRTIQAKSLKSLSHIVLIDFIIDIRPSVDGYPLQFLVEFRYVIYQLHQVGIVSGSCAFSQLFHHFLEALFLLVVSAYSLGGSLHAVA